VLSKLALKGGAPLRTTPFPSWPIYGEEEAEALRRVLYSGVWGVGGTETMLLEERFSAYQDAKYGVATMNGSVALDVALRSAGVGAGDSVILPAYTFIASLSSIILVNATPVFADIDSETYCIDPEKIEEAITGKTRAIMPVHVAGHPADMDRMTKIAEEYGLIIVEDACQAHGSRWKGQGVGAIGNLGVFSFQSSKNMTSGEGGMVLTNDEELYQRCWSLHNCGRVKSGDWYEHRVLGNNYRMTEFQAAVLLEQMKRLENQTAKRSANAEYLTRRLSEIEGIVPLKRDPRVTAHSYHLFIFQFNSESFRGLPRQRFIEALKAEGVPCSPGYKPLNSIPWVQELLPNKKTKLPITERACEEAVWLKQSVLLGTRDDMDDVADAMLKIRENVKEIL